MSAISEIAAGPPALRRAAHNLEVALALLARPVRGRVAEPWPIDRRLLAVAAAASLVLLLLGMFFIDGPVMRSVTHLPRAITWFFDQVTDFGKSGWFLWPLGVLFLALAALPATMPRMAQLVLAALMVRVGFLFTAIAVPGLFDTVIKRLIGRGRPTAGTTIDPTLFHPFGWNAEFASLPSGHATTAFAVLVAFGTLWPRARTAFLLYALVIAVSRIVVMGHYPTDVVAGAVVGSVGAMMVRRWFALRHLGFAVGADGTVRQFPGPSLRRIKAVARDLLSE